MPCSLDCLGYLPLELEGSTGKAARENLSLLVQELLEELCVLVVNIFDTCFLETALFLSLYLYCRRVEITYFIVLCHNSPPYLACLLALLFSAYATACLSIAKVRYLMILSSRRYWVSRTSINCESALNSIR